MVIPADIDGHAPGLERLQDLGLGAVTFPATGTSEDLTLLLADAHDAALIVTVGMHTTLTELLDRSHGSAASTFLVRMRVANKVVEAPAVAELYKARISWWAVAFLVVAAIAAIVAALLVSDVSGTYGDLIRQWWNDAITWVRGLFSMISMRYHIVSLAAIFLALALGIVLGATKINSPLLQGLQGDNTSLSTQHDDLTKQNETLTARVSATRSSPVRSAHSRSAAPCRTATVVLITTDTADPADRDAVLSLLTRAGATVTAQIQVTADFADPARADELRTLATQNLPTGATLPEVVAGRRASPAACSARCC